MGTIAPTSSGRSRRFLRRDRQSGSIGVADDLPPIGELRYAEEVLGLQFSTSHCALRPAPHVIRYRQAAACPRAAQKTQTYRSLRFPAVAALVPSAGTITLQIELRSDADAVSTPHPVRVRALRGARPTHRTGDTGYRGRPREARYSRAPNFDIAKVVQNRNGSAPAQLRSVTQQRCRMHSIGGGGPHFGT
jgi:hypothetical protein